MERIVKLLCLLLALIGVQAMAQVQTLKVWGHDLTMTADGKTYTHLTISESDVVNYTAFNMTIVVPEGISIAQITSGRLVVNDIQLNPDRNSGAHTISCNMTDKNTIKIIGYSTDLYDLYHSDEEGNLVEELFTIGLVADSTMINGEYDIKIIDCKFVQKKGISSVCDNAISLKLTVQGGVESTVINYQIDATQFGTIILPFNATLPEGVRAFECTHVEDGIVKTNELKDIPANTPLLLNGPVGEYTFTGLPDSSEDSYCVGLLTGVLKDTEISNGYVLKVQNETLGFYPLQTAQPVVIPKYHCYLLSDQNLNSILLGDLITDIDKIGLDDDGNKMLYDIHGKKIATPNMRGVYVSNNKKIYVK